MTPERLFELVAGYIVAVGAGIVLGIAGVLFLAAIIRGLFFD